jgi:alanine-synthesizing transaminase
MFSRRVPGDRRPNRVARAVSAARAAGRQLVDLTISNPTVIGLDYPASLLAPLASSAALQYRPHPFGLQAARDAVARDYARRGISLATDRIVLTSSTSEAYSLLFKLLCGTDGDTVLVPVPSYPLFDHLTRLDGVRAAAYRLEYHGRWMLDTDTLDESWTPNVRAILAVSPNNPTGSILSTAELDELAARALHRSAALIVDEVFADFPLQDVVAPPVHTFLSLTFRLGGLSKSAGLPQVKLGWIAVDGPESLVREALDRLELICDTYLSVSTPVQIAAADLIAAGAAIRRQLLARIRSNYAELQRLASLHPSVALLAADAGWSAVVRVPSTRTEEDLVLELVERDGVLVHPGFFFDFPHEAFVVVSLLPEPSAFARGAQIAMERAGA